MDRVVISGGGTGGHIFPAIAIANELKDRFPTIDVLFVGALGKMEMQKVPAAGYKIIGLPITGFQRRITLSNFLLPFKLIYSLFLAYRLIKKFNPDVVIGVGGYASGPTLRMAALAGIPSVIQEQNSFPGKTNQLLAKHVSKVCVAYDGLDVFFPASKLIFTGNPVRNEVITITGKRENGINFFKLDPSRKTILIVGGSLGARTLNESIVSNLDIIYKSGCQVLWQCGSYYFPQLNESNHLFVNNRVHLNEFIKEMDLAYSVADIIVSRAGAISISELCLVKKPIILVPSPNVAEDHQTKNALALSSKNAALLVSDISAKTVLIPTVLSTLKDDVLMKELSMNISKLGINDAANRIVNELVNLVSHGK